MLPLVSGFGFRVPYFGFRVSGSGFWGLGFGNWVLGFGFRVSGSRCEDSRFGISAIRFLSGFGFRVSGFGRFRVSGCRGQVLDSGLNPPSIVRFRVSGLGVRLPSHRVRVYVTLPASSLGEGSRCLRLGLYPQSIFRS